MNARRLLACTALAMALAVASNGAQAFHYEDIDGRPQALAAYKGKWVVLNVWATWCAPCIHEMPELDALARSRLDVVVLGVAADNAPPARLRGFAKSLKVSYPIIAASREQVAQLNVKAYPTTLLFDPNGALVATRLGQVTRLQLEEQLAALCRR